MAGKSSIEWTQCTWNPVTGCTKISSGCKNCYAERFAKRLQAMGLEAYNQGFKVKLQPRILDAPLKWRKPRMIFVNSMSDLFHKAVPDDYVSQVFDVMASADRHIFQVLTKRPERMLKLDRTIPWANHIWMGVTVESAEYVGRIDLLRPCGARVKFLSLEPLLGPLKDLNLDGIDWVIVGGESGPGSRPIEIEWVRDIRDQCLAAGVPFFFKQWGGQNKKKNGRKLDGKTWSQMPGAHGLRESGHL